MAQEADLCGWIEMLNSIEHGCTNNSTIDRVVAIHGQRLVVSLCDKHDKALDQVHARRRADKRQLRVDSKQAS
jgi:hypothetical protein